MSERVVKKRMSDGTVKEYRYARKASPAPEAEVSRPGHYVTGTLGRLLKDYEDSPEWRRLSRATKYHRNIYLRYLTDAHGLRVEEIERQHLIKTRNVIDKDSGPGAANAFIRTVRIVFNWALDNGMTAHANPAARIKMLEEKPLPTFTPEQVAEAERRLPEPLRRVMVLGRYTVQRRGDLIRLTWANYDGRTLRFTQQKRKLGQEPMEVAFEVHPALKAELDVWRAEAEAALAEAKVVSLTDRRSIARQTILLNFDGRPWQNNVTERMREHLERIGLREKGEKGVNIHGLRKRGATWLAEEGFSTHEIAAVTGHKTIAMVQKYTEKANREKLATGVFNRLSQRSDKN